jgi:hypothetical protein
MIGLPFAPEKGAGKTAARRLASLVRFDDIRIMQLLENIQYGVIYFILGFISGTALDTMFPMYDEKKPIHQVVFEILGQVICVVLVAFYIKKIAKVVPFLFVLNWGHHKGFRPYESMEYGGDITIGLVLLGSQFNFLKKIDMVSRELYSDYLGFTERVPATL